MKNVYKNYLLHFKTRINPCLFYICKDNLVLVATSTIALIYLKTHTKTIQRFMVRQFSSISLSEG